MMDLASIAALLRAADELEEAFQLTVTPAAMRTHYPLLVPLRSFANAVGQ